MFQANAKLLLILAIPFAASAQSNPELARIFAEDQVDRAHQFTLTPEQFSAIAKKDLPRRQRVHELLAAGALHTSEDYVRAAFIYQHGSEPDDFLMAHVLGMVATKIDGGGIWISAASLDRYLLMTGKPQIFGLSLDDKHPFDRTLISDPLREAVCAPTIADRAKFMAAIAKDPEHPIANNPCTPDPKALMGKWLLTRKSATGEFTHVTLNFSLDKNGEPDLSITAPGYPPHPEMQMTMGGEILEIKVNGEVFNLVVKGDIITGRYTSKESSGTVVGLR